MSLGGAVQAADCLLVCRQSADELLTSYSTKPETDEKHENELKAEHDENDAKGLNQAGKRYTNT